MLYPVDVLWKSIRLSSLIYHLILSTITYCGFSKCSFLTYSNISTWFEIEVLNAFYRVGEWFPSQTPPPPPPPPPLQYPPSIFIFRCHWPKTAQQSWSQIINNHFYIIFLLSHTGPQVPNGLPLISDLSEKITEPVYQVCSHRYQYYRESQARVK